MKVSILGCGWLGFPLAKKLIEDGFEIKGSTTSENKLDILQSHKIRPFLIELSEDKINGNINEFLNDSNILIIDIPPGLRKDALASHGMTFVNKIKTLLPYIENSNIEKVVFISSTSVYGDSVSIPVITEESVLHPDTENGKQLVEVENIVRNNRNFDSIIIRFGGLIGEDRNPIKFLAGKTNIANPEAPINFIHQKDCIGIIDEMLKQHFDKLSVTVMHDKIWNETYNAVALNHPTRKAYYTQKAIEFNLPQPEFNEEEPSIGKIISSEKLLKNLDYTFKIKI